MCFSDLVLCKPVPVDVPAGGLTWSWEHKIAVHSWGEWAAGDGEGIPEIPLAPTPGTVSSGTG